MSGIFVAREALTKSAAIEELSRLPSRNAMTSGALTTVPDRSVFVEYLVKRLSENREPYLLAADLFSHSDLFATGQIVSAGLHLKTTISQGALLCSP